MAAPSAHRPSMPIRIAAPCVALGAAPAVAAAAAHWTGGVLALALGVVWLVLLGRIIGLLLKPFAGR